MYNKTHTLTRTDIISMAKTIIFLITQINKLTEITFT